MKRYLLAALCLTFSLGAQAGDLTLENSPQAPKFESGILNPDPSQIFIEEQIRPTFKITPQFETRKVTVVPTDLEVKGTIKSPTTSHLLIWNIVLTVAFVAILL